MSMMTNLRDITASIMFGRELQAVRDAQLQQMLDGQPMSDEQLRAAEQEAVLRVARQLYSDKTALAMGFAKAPGERDHKRDYAARTNANADAAALFTHRVICELPVVGDPAHAFGASQQVRP